MTRTSPKPSPRHPPPRSFGALTHREIITTLSTLTVASILLGWVIYSNWDGVMGLWWSMFGISGGSTAQDYRTAPAGSVEHYWSHMCDNGVCYDEQNLEPFCGFPLPDPISQMDDCVDRVATKASPTVKMETIAHACAQYLIVYDDPIDFDFVAAGRDIGAQVSSPFSDSDKASLKNSEREECVSRGGHWGMRPPLTREELRLIRSAGLE